VSIKVFCNPDPYIYFSAVFCLDTCLFVYFYVVIYTPYKIIISNLPVGNSCMTA